MGKGVVRQIQTVAIITATDEWVGGFLYMMLWEAVDCQVQNHENNPIPMIIKI